MSKRLLFSVLFTLVALFGQAQYQLTVDTVEFLERDIRARRYAPEDNNGKKGALVCIQVPLISDMEIVGAILEKKPFAAGEYLVYVAAGTKKLTLKHSNLESLELVFADYGVKIESQCVYRVRLLLPERFNNGRNMQQTAQYLEFDGVPGNARIYVDGKLWASNRQKVRFGTYQYRIEAYGYAPDSGSVYVDKQISVPIRMHSIKSRLFILDPEKKYKGAEVQIDGEPKGVLPLPDGIFVEAGERSITIKKNMYSPVETIIPIEEGKDFHYSLAMDNNFNTFRLIVDNDPNAEIYLEGKKIGQGEWEGPLEFTQETWITTMRENCHNWDTVVVLTNESDLEIHLGAPTPMVGSLEIRANVDGADVFIDGNDIKQKTPCQIDNLLVGNHSIELRHNGVQWYGSKIVLEGELASIYALMAQQETVLLQMNVPSADIVINDKMKGHLTNSEVPFRWFVDSVYNIKLSHEGYYDLDTTIVFNASIKSLKTNLIPLPSETEIRKNEYYHHVGNFHVNWFAANLEAGTTFGIDASFFNTRFKWFEINWVQVAAITPLYQIGMTDRPYVSTRPEDWMLCYEPEVKLHMSGKRHVDWYFGFGAVLPFGTLFGTNEKLPKMMQNQNVPLLHNMDATNTWWPLADFGFQKTGKIGAFNMFLRYDGGVALCMGFALGSGYRKPELLKVE